MSFVKTRLSYTHYPSLKSCCWDENLAIANWRSVPTTIIVIQSLFQRVCPWPLPKSWIFTNLASRIVDWLHNYHKSFQRASSLLTCCLRNFLGGHSFHVFSTTSILNCRVLKSGFPKKEGVHLVIYVVTLNLLSHNFNHTWGVIITITWCPQHPRHALLNDQLTSPLNRRSTSSIFALIGDYPELSLPLVLCMVTGRLWCHRLSRPFPRP